MKVSKETLKQIILEEIKIIFEEKDYTVIKKAKRTPFDDWVGTAGAMMHWVLKPEEQKELAPRNWTLKNVISQYNKEFPEAYKFVKQTAIALKQMDDPHVRTAIHDALSELFSYYRKHQKVFDQSPLIKKLLKDTSDIWELIQ